MLVTRKNFAGKEATMDLNVTVDQLAAWRAGALIQNVMPQLTDCEREFLISGMLPGEWEKLFGEEEV
jgi:hypothetical protein